MSFENYLQKQKLRESTVYGHLQDVRRFKEWCNEKSINYNKATYNELLKFIQSRQKKGVGKSSINIHLNSIRKYFDYLLQLKERKDNPASELRLKNNGRKVYKQLFSVDQLDEFYTTYQIRQQWEFRGEISRRSHRRNSVILGLIVYQGVQTSELSKMEKEHLNLLQGTVYIPSNPKGNSRILKLNARQILPMQIYLQDLQKNEEKLFSSSKLSNAVFYTMRELRKSYEKETVSAPHIRASVIMNWLKQNNIRQVQYMAGHKQISSTERYKEEDIHDLQKQLELYHPLK